MKYTVYLDQDNYITCVATTLNNDTELDLESMDLQHLNAYKLIDGEAVLDNEKLAELIALEERHEKDEEIAGLTEQLHSSDEDLLDFIENLFTLKNPLTFISDMIALMKNYVTLVATRQSIRERIRELQK